MEHDKELILYDPLAQKMVKFCLNDEDYVRAQTGMRVLPKLFN